MRKCKVTISREIVADENPDLSWLEQDHSDCTPEVAAEYRAQDAKRLDEYRRGWWQMVGVRAVAKVEIPASSGGYWILQTIESPGLWGLESDCGEEYLARVFEEEKITLIAMLDALAAGYEIYGQESDI